MNDQTNLTQPIDDTCQNEQIGNITQNEQSLDQMASDQINDVSCKCEHNETENSGLEVEIKIKAEETEAEQTDTQKENSSQEALVFTDFEQNIISSTASLYFSLYQDMTDKLRCINTMKEELNKETTKLIEQKIIEIDQKTYDHFVKEIERYTEFLLDHLHTLQDLLTASKHIVSEYSIGMPMTNADAELLMAIFLKQNFFKTLKKNLQRDYSGFHYALERQIKSLELTRITQAS